jgi:hypothetical protein
VTWTTAIIYKKTQSVQNTEVEKMNVKKAIKKIAAVGAATTLVGATLLSAMAQVPYDLNQYPAPYVNEGVFDIASSVIVIGENAEMKDMLGAIEIAASLQADSVSDMPIDIDGTAEATINDGVKIARSGEDLNYGEFLADIDSKLTDTDLPSVLGDGVFDDSEGATDNEVDFTQDIEFDSASGELTYEKNDDTDVTASYLKFPKGTTMYTYTFDFDGDAVDFSSSAVNADFEGVTFDVQGAGYTITSARADSSDHLDRLKLLVGDVVRWVSQDAPVNVGDSTVTVISVDNDGEKCGIEVDGETKWLSLGETKTIGGLEVGLLDAIAVHSELADQDTCELSLGSQEIILEDGQEVQINGKDVDNSEVLFVNATGDEWDGFTITYEPDDDLYLSAGDSWVDPVLGNWKIIYQGVTAKTEMITATGGSTEGKVTFMNLDGVEVEVPYRENSTDSGVIFGDDEDYENTLSNSTGGNVLNGGIAFAELTYCLDSDVTDCEGLYFMATSTGDEARLLELYNIDEGDNKVTVKDLSTGRTYVETYVSGSNVAVDVGFMEVTLKVTEGTSVGFIDFNNGDIKTEYGAVLTFAEGAVDGELDFTLEENPDETDPAPVTISWTVSENTDDEVEVETPDAPTLEQEEDGSDDEIGSTDYGTIVRYDSENSDKLEFTYPEEAAYGTVFVAPLNAEVTAGGSSSYNAQKVNKIPVGMSVLDVDAESMNKHMIAVGGPCVNVISDEVTGDKASCTEGFSEGKAKIAAYARGTKNVLMVAGFGAQDTRAAAYVLANHKDYPQLEGTEVELAVASLTDVTFVTMG